MLLATITVSMSRWVWVAGVLTLAALALMFWSYRRWSIYGTRGFGSGVLAHIGGIAFALKILGISILALCLIEPLWSGRRARVGANLFAVVADNSGGMSIHDLDTEQSRGEIMQSALQTGTRGWLAALAETFEVRRYMFDSRLRRTVDFSDLTFDGKATSLGTALRTLAERYEGRPLAGILVMTDGCATDIGDTLPDLSGVAPVYPIVVGQGRSQNDISLANVSVGQTSFEDAPVTIQADAEATGFAGRTAEVDLLDASGGIVERRQWDIREEEARQTFRFRLRPDESGVVFYSLRVSEKLVDVPPAEPEVPTEATLANNGRTIVVDRGKGPYRVLYVAGRPNWEFKFLKRAIDEDEQVQLVGLLRVARREPKYDFRGRAGETSNPLYRGFDAADQEEAEQYDQPVLVRLNTRDEKELRDGFPKTAEDLFGYHAVILDDIEAEFFSHDQMDLIRRFVTERGGGFLMLGGKESFRRGGFDRTPIASILPTYLDPVVGGSAAPQVRLSLTREGWLQPWARLRDNEVEERQRLLEMPEMRVLNRLEAVKPGATAVAVVEEESHPFPALVVHQVGNGRAAALALGDVWRWGLYKAQMRADMDKFWRQTLRWLIADVPAQMSLEADLRLDEGNQPVALQVRVRDKAFEPMDNVSVAVEVREPEGRNVQVTASPVLTESGLFEATYVPRASGGYRVHARVTDMEGAGLGDAQTGWAVDLEAREFQSIKPNRPLLETIARQTGGRVVDAGGLDRFVRDLPHRKVPISDVWVKPLWDLPGVLPVAFLLILTSFVVEWALRRWRGMP